MIGQSFTKPSIDSANYVVIKSLSMYACVKMLLSNILFESIGSLNIYRLLFLQYCNRKVQQSQKIACSWAENNVNYKNICGEY